MNRLESLKNIISYIRQLYINEDFAEKVAKAIEEYIESNVGSMRISLEQSNEYIWEINSIINSITHDLHFYIAVHNDGGGPNQSGISMCTPHYIGISRLDGIGDVNNRREITRAFDQLQDPVIMDLRGCRGGNSEAMLYILSHLFEDGVPLIEVSNRTCPPVVLKSVSTIKHYGTEDTIKKYTGRLKVLINNYTFSGGEIIAKTLQTHKRAKIYGSPTVGMSGMTNIIQFDKLDLHIPNVKITDAFSKEDLEQKGVIPDFGPMTKEYISTVFSELFGEIFSNYQ